MPKKFIEQEEAQITNFEMRSKLFNDLFDTTENPYDELIDLCRKKIEIFKTTERMAIRLVTNGQQSRFT